MRRVGLNPSIFKVTLDKYSSRPEKIYCSMYKVIFNVQRDNARYCVHADYFNGECGGPLTLTLINEVCLGPQSIIQRT